MARNFLSLPFAPYQGVLSSRPFNDARGHQKGLMVGLKIDWANYKANGRPLGTLNPDFAVTVNLNAAGPNTVSQSWNIQSVYVDNEGVDFPVYVYFNDTQFAISCPANSAGWYQVFTNARGIIISGLGITDSSVNVSTAVFFTDAAMTPYLDQEILESISLWKASAAINDQGLTFFDSKYNAPALGDQLLQVQMPAFGAPDASLGFFGYGPDFPNNYLYITQFQCVANGIISSGGAGNSYCTIRTYLQNSLDGNRMYAAFLGGNPNSGTTQLVCDIRGNFKFLPNLIWKLSQTLSVNAVGGEMEFSIAYTAATQ